MLPPEILGLVCRNLPKNVLKQVRQVSKMWDSAVVPYLFDEIFISHDIADFRIAKLVILRFKHCIRTLVFSSVYYTEMDRESFDERMDGEFDVDADSVNDTGIRHSDHAFTLYRIARKNQQENIANGSASAYLSFVLTSLPHIRKIILTDSSSTRSMSCQSLQVYQSRLLKVCSIKDCDLTANEHLHAVAQSGFSRKGSTNPWRLVLFALRTTSASVKELTMEPRDMGLATKAAAFSMSPGDLGQTKLTFRNLTKIRFSLLVDTRRYSINADTRYVHQNITKLLRVAVNLESLSLDIFENGLPLKLKATLYEILGRCKFPKLRSLNLAFLASSDVELLRLLRHSRKLEHLTIECHNLTRGSWVRVADWIRASLPLLKHAELNGLYGGFDDPWKKSKYMDSYGYVGDFLFAHGENPFTTKALEKYHADKNANRQMVNDVGKLSFIDAYFKYH